MNLSAVTCPRWSHAPEAWRSTLSSPGRLQQGKGAATCPTAYRDHGDSDSVKCADEHLPGGEEREREKGSHELCRSVACEIRSGGPRDLPAGLCRRVHKLHESRKKLSALFTHLQHPGNIYFNAMTHLLRSFSVPDNEDSKMKETQRAGLGFWSTRSVREDDEVLRPVTNIRGIKSIPGGAWSTPTDVAHSECQCATHTDQGSANTFHAGPDSKYFVLCGPSRLCCNDPTLRL